jgi:hypothetical protein
VRYTAAATTATMLSRLKGPRAPPPPSGSATKPRAAATARMMIHSGFVSLPAATKEPDFCVSASMSAQTSIPNASTLRRRTTRFWIE